MIYTPRRRLLSPALSGYMRASTDNPNGWRPEYTRLSGPGLPDWKTVVAVREAQSRQQQQGIAALQRSEMRKLAYYDAVARGVGLRGLGTLGIGGLALNSAPIQGLNYTFYFQQSSFLGISSGLPGMQALAAQVATDANFGNPSAVTMKDRVTVAVTFTYMQQPGPGTTIGTVGGEMENVINTWGLMGLMGLNFVGADGGKAVVAAQTSTQQGDSCSQDSDCGSGFTCPNGTCQANSNFDLGAWVQSNWLLIAALGVGAVVATKAL